VRQEDSFFVDYHRIFYKANYANKDNGRLSIGHKPGTGVETMRKKTFLTGILATALVFGMVLA
jgi:hypothetical protein